MPQPVSHMHSLDVPLRADPVLLPVVHYADTTAIHFRTHDERWGRVTFERLDSLKVSRGEAGPFPEPPGDWEWFHWVGTVSNSQWLTERYEYEKRHYGDSYQICGNVDEMLEEYAHYVFTFHDEFVEAIAAGIWFDVSDELNLDRELDTSHPLEGLAHIQISEEFESSGIRCFVRRNPLPEAELHRAARLCSQTVLEISIEPDRIIKRRWFLTLRVINGTTRFYFRDSFGNSLGSRSGVPSLKEIRRLVDRELQGNSEPEQNK